MRPREKSTFRMGEERESEQEFKRQENQDFKARTGEVAQLIMLLQRM